MNPSEAMIQATGLPGVLYMAESALTVEAPLVRLHQQLVQRGAAGDAARHVVHVHAIHIIHIVHIV